MYSTAVSVVDNAMRSQLERRAIVCRRFELCPAKDSRFERPELWPKKLGSRRLCAPPCSWREVIDRLASAEHPAPINSRRPFALQLPSY
jgi:hypothetical protein